MEWICQVKILKVCDDAKTAPHTAPTEATVHFRMLLCVVLRSEERKTRPLALQHSCVSYEWVCVLVLCSRQTATPMNYLWNNKNHRHTTPHHTTPETDTPHKMYFYFGNNIVTESTSHQCSDGNAGAVAVIHFLFIHVPTRWCVERRTYLLSFCAESVGTT